MNAYQNRLAEALPGAPEFLGVLKRNLRVWRRRAGRGLQEVLAHQFAEDAKYFRALTVYACAQSVIACRRSSGDGDAPSLQRTLLRAQVVEMIHNMTLIIDDVVDRSPERRGQLVPHTRCSPLTAFMVSGYIVADAFELLSEQRLAGVRRRRGATRWSRHLPESRGSTIESDFLPESTFRRMWSRTEKSADTPLFDHRLVSELIKRLAVVECLQWDFRRDGALLPAERRRDALLGLADWHFLAREDTGSMFEICAAMGAQSQAFRTFGRLLGMLYHGCDDVADVRTAYRTIEGSGLGPGSGLGGTGLEDIRDRILTLPAALALDDDRTRRLFREGRGGGSDPAGPLTEDEIQLLHAFHHRLDDAERELDRIANQIAAEIGRLQKTGRVADPDPLQKLVEYVRPLSAH